jgi:predicted acylesterase/phospholipase RssA
LYDHHLIAPTTIVGTSAGSIVATMLAQSLDPDEQARHLRTLEDYWLAMTEFSEMYVEQAWFTKLREQWEQLAPALPERGDTDPIFVDANTDDPRATFRAALEADPSTESSDFSLSTLWQMMGAFGRISRVGPGLASSLRGAERAASAYRPGPIVDRLLFESGFSSQAVAESGVRLRLAFVGLNSGNLHFMRQDGVIVGEDDHPVQPTHFDIPLGMWASCAIPGVFRPVKLGGEVYVDGGVRDNTAVHMCVTGLGAARPYVIVCDTSGLPYDDYSNKDIISLMGRSISILMDETGRDEVDWAREVGATVIEPLIDVHSVLQVEPGLLRINRDYGWMRAAEVTTGTVAGTTGPIVQTRLELYHRLTDPTVKASADAEVARLRARLRTLIAAADPALLPAGYDRWPDETWPMPAR